MSPLISATTHLFLLFGHSLPDLACLLGKICDTDAGMVRLDLLSAGIEPQHVGRHWPLGGIGVSPFLHLHKNPSAFSHLFLIDVPPVLQNKVLITPT